MNCPKCKYTQYCPCVSCKDRLPKKRKPWIWDKEGEFITCARCGLTKHADWWEDKAYKQYKQSMTGER